MAVKWLGMYLFTQILEPRLLICIQDDLTRSEKYEIHTHISTDIADMYELHTSISEQHPCATEWSSVQSVLVLDKTVTLQRIYSSPPRSPTTPFPSLFPLQRCSMALMLCHLTTLTTNSPTSMPDPDFSRQHKPPYPHHTFPVGIPNLQLSALFRQLIQV